MNHWNHWKSTAVFLSLILLTGCESLTPHRISARLEERGECGKLLVRMDEAVAKTGVGDASSYPVPGFPYLRADRFLAAVGKYAKEEEQREQWAEMMRQLDLGARKKELRSLPPGELFDSSGRTAAAQADDGLYANIRSCSEKLYHQDLGRAGFFEALYPQVKVPDEYSFVLRPLGLYPLTSFPVALITKRAQQRFKGWYDTPLEKLPVFGRIERFVPAEPRRLTQDEIKSILEVSARNPLRIPLPGDSSEKDLAAYFAPIIMQDVAGFYDRPGKMTRVRDRVTVASQDPAVYYYISYAFLHDQPILQIIYVIWYPERAGKNAPWMERGHLDGLTVRVSLDRDGRVFMVDMMNNCGCYHLFAPRKGDVIYTMQENFWPGAFVPQWLPDVPPGDRLGIRVSAGWHQAQRLYAEPEQSDTKTSEYQLIPYDTLESLPDETGKRASIFTPTGILAGSERIEPLILFSMGIPSIGSMRQRGHHAIEFTERVHFDDPYLFERYFIFK